MTYSPVPSAIKLLLLYSVNSARASSFVRPHAIKFSLPVTFLRWYILSDSPLSFDLLFACGEILGVRIHEDAFLWNIVLWCNKHTNNLVYTYWIWIWIKIFLKDYFQLTLFLRIWLLCICRRFAKRYWPLLQNCKLRKATFDTCFFLMFCWNLCKQKYACMQTWKERDGEWRLVKFLTF